MPSKHSFRINAPRVVSENIDGEVVMIDLDTGMYYSTDAIGAEVWDLIGAGRTFPEIFELIRTRYSGDPAAIEAELDGFLAKLEMGELIAEPKAPVPRNEAYVLAATRGGERAPFVPPTLTKYNDMQEILLLDPIHDVEETGWPTPKPTEDNA